MEVRLISYSQTPYPDHAVPDSMAEMVAFCARVSNPSNQDNAETSEKLLNYLAKHKHWSPFEMVSACLEITTTRDIARQILRHRSFSFQEVSQRYANPVDEMTFEIREARLQDTKNRQNSIATENVELHHAWTEKQQAVIDKAVETYEWAIENGIAKEQARCVLPEGNTVSRMYMNGTLRSWLHYIDLRGDNGTQLEHMQIAHQVAKVIAGVFPIRLTLSVT